MIPADHNDPGKVFLNLQHLVHTPTDGVARESCEIQTDPISSPQDLLRLANDPDVSKFEAIAHALADASDDLAVEFDAASLDGTVPLELAQGLRRAPRLPQAVQVEKLEVIERRVLLLRSRRRRASDALGKADEPDQGPSECSRLHGAVKTVAAHVSNLLLVIQRYGQLGTGLVYLDQHLQSPTVDPEPATPKRAATWRSTIQGLQQGFADALQLWEKRPPGSNTCLRLVFARAARTPVVCGPIRRLTYHDLVIAIGRIILNPEDAHAVSPNEIGMIGLPSGTEHHGPRLIRRQLVEAMHARPWWEDLKLGLEREYADVLGLLGSAPRATNPSGVASTEGGSPTPPQEPDQPEFSAVEKALVLLQRDLQRPQSIRYYADKVGVHHSTLSRNEVWKGVWERAQELAKKGPHELTQGSIDQDGNLEARLDDLCENCRQERIARSVDVGGTSMRLCEACAEKHAPRTK